MAIPINKLQLMKNNVKSHNILMNIAKCNKVRDRQIGDLIEKVTQTLIFLHYFKLT